MLRGHIVVVVFFVLSMQYFDAKTQDIHFSQFYATPLTLNPAYTGNFTGDWRLAGIYRDQWRAISPAMMTAAASFDKIFTVFNHDISAGAVLVHDRSGDAKLNVTKIFLSGAYHLKISKHTLSGGLQLGFVDKRIDNSALTFPEQFDESTGYFNSQLTLRP